MKQAPRCGPRDASWELHPCHPVLASKTDNVSSSAKPTIYSTHHSQPSHHNPTMPAKRAPQISSNASTVPPIPKSTSSSSSKSSSSTQTAQDVLLNLWQHYLNTTPQRVKLIDVFMAFLVVVGGLQFVYCVLVGNYVGLLFFIFFFVYIITPSSELSAWPRLTQIGKSSERNMWLD